MENFSQLSRSGILQGNIQHGTLDNGRGAGIPFLAFSILSTISIGFGETVEETTKVLVCGMAAECWNDLPEQPKEGDTILIQGATTYVKNGVLCCRAQVPGQVFVISSGTQELRSGSVVSADEFFLRLWEQQKANQSTT